MWIQDFKKEGSGRYNAFDCLGSFFFFSFNRLKDRGNLTKKVSVMIRVLFQSTKSKLFCSDGGGIKVLLFSSWKMLTAT